MHKETASLMSLGECDPALVAKITQDIERIVRLYITRNEYDIGSTILTQHQHNIERIALRALKNQLNNAPNIY